MKVIALVAFSDGRVIGSSSHRGLLWYIPTDLKYFKKLTSRKKSIMLVGPKTYSTLPISVKNRNIMIIKRDDIPKISNIFNKLRPDYNQIFIIGGSWLYHTLLQYTDEIRATRIYHDYNGDKYFPKIRKSDWCLNFYSRILYYKDKKNKNNESVIKFRFLKYLRVSEEKQYLNILRRVIHDGIRKGNTLSIFGSQMRFSLLNNTFPLLTTKKMFYRGVIEELLWMIRGETDISILRSKNVHIWDKNSNRESLNKLGLTKYREFDGGPIYGFNFRYYGAKYHGCDKKYHNQGVDQLNNAIQNIIQERDKLLQKEEYRPNRRIIINLWNPSQLSGVCLPPCHILYQFSVHREKENIYLSCMMYQRSGDLGLGVPFNIASASLLTIILAKKTNTLPYEFIHTIADTHIYTSHLKVIKEQITRKPYKFPTIHLNNNIKDKKIEDITFKDFNIKNYQSHNKLKMKLII
jgi:thymidylate synthase